MQFFEWNNKGVGDFDIFVMMCEDEKNAIVAHYNTAKAEGVSFFDEEKYFYFINTKKRTITPMPMLSLAFGGQYNDSLPYGSQIKDFKLDITEYALVMYER